MESKRTTRASSQDVTSVRRGTRKSPGRKRSPSPIAEEDPKPKSARGRPKSASRKEEKTPQSKSPKKTPASKTDSKADKSPQKKSPRGRKPAGTTASTISSASTTKTITLSSAAGDIKNRLRASLTPMTRSMSRSVSRSVYDREFSDDELDNTNEDRPGSAASFGRRSKSRQPQDRLSRYGVVGSALLVLGMIAVTLGVVIACNSTGCNPKWATLKRTLSQCSTWYDAQATAVGVLFIAALSLVSALPTGRVVSIAVDEDETKTYTYNGFATFVLSLGVALFATDGLQFIYRHYLHLFVLSLLTAIVVSVGAFVRSRFQPAESLNAFARTQRPVYDFIIGREVNPRWFNRIDAKLVFFRLSIITTLLLNIVFLTKTVVLPQLALQWTPSGILAFVTGIRADVATTTATSMVILYCLDLLIFEHHLTSSFAIQCEGFGALVLLRYCLFPFVISVVPKYVLENATAAPWWIVSIMAVLFAAGLVVKRCAEQIKYSYRMYPADPRFDNLDTIATFQGQGLLADSLWKVVRHPNYLGELVIYVSFLPLLAVRFAWAPLVAILYLICAIVHRTLRVDHRSNIKYNSSWAQYSKIVPKMLVPRVF